MAITKATETVTDWTAVTDNAIGESATLDCSGSYATDLCIQAGLDTTNAHTGTTFTLQVSSNTTDDEDWQNYTVFSALRGTATTDLIENDPLNAAETSLTLTGHSFTEEGVWLLIEDGTLINSELISVASQTANAVVALDGVTNTHALNTPIFNVAISKAVPLDRSVNRARVLVDNTYLGTGADSSLNYKVRATTVTAI